MHHLSTLSWIITALGLLLVLAASIASLGPEFLLTGILLTLAGAVKIAVVFIWRHVANL